MSECKHGNLARKCERCYLEIEITDLRDALNLCVKELQHRHTARIITSDEAEALRTGKAILDRLEQKQ